MYTSTQNRSKHGVGNYPCFIHKSFGITFILPSGTCIFWKCLYLEPKRRVINNHNHNGRSIHSCMIGYNDKYDQLNHKHSLTCDHYNGHDIYCYDCKIQPFIVDLTLMSGMDLDKLDIGHTILGNWYEYGWEIVKCHTISVLAQISLDELSSKPVAVVCINLMYHQIFLNRVKNVEKLSL